VHFCSFGTSGECAKHAYAPSPTAHINFFLQVRPKRRTLILFFSSWLLNDGHEELFKEIAIFLSQDLIKVAFSFRTFKRRRGMR
jgi:hypothetical protein